MVLTRRQTAMIKHTVVAAKNVAKKASVQANVHVVRAKKAAVQANKAVTAAKKTATVAKRAASIAVAAASSAAASPVRKVRRKRRYTMRMQRAVYTSPSMTPMRAVRHKHLDKYKRRIFVGPRGGKFAMRPSGGRTYAYQEAGNRYPVYGVYKKTATGAIRMLKKFLGVFTTKRRALKK
jgi:hypothetical protein